MTIIQLYKVCPWHNFYLYNKKKDIVGNQYNPTSCCNRQVLVLYTLYPLVHLRHLNLKGKIYSTFINCNFLSGQITLTLIRSLDVFNFIVRHFSTFSELETILFGLLNKTSVKFIQLWTKNYKRSTDF